VPPGLSVHYFTTETDSSSLLCRWIEASTSQQKKNLLIRALMGCGQGLVTRWSVEKVWSRAQKCGMYLCLVFKYAYTSAFCKVTVTLAQSWSWVGSIHGLGWVGSEFLIFGGLGWVGWRLDCVIFLTSWNTLLSANEYCSWMITVIDCELVCDV